MMTTAARRPPQTEAPASRLERLAWNDIEAQLEALGYATAGPLLTPAECLRITRLYDDPARFRRRIVMQRHAYGEGEYQYFAYPLPDVVAALRQAAYPKLAPVANRWQAQLGLAGAYPDHLEDFLSRCHEAGQTRPTPLLLKYGPGDYNRLHQDLYGALHFPLQMAILLSAPGTDFEGGEFVLTEQRPRTQSRVEVVPLQQGEAVIFAVNVRPGRGARGHYRLAMRHGVSRLRAGSRYTLGIIFHDAA
jgi:hypothetical protein